MKKSHFEKKELYSVREVSEIIGMSFSWVDKAIRAGVIKNIWIGGVRKIKDSELQKLISG